jgi:putative ABC transport system substrate-binding protein
VLISSALGTVIGTARHAGIPVFSIVPGDPERGTLFDLGIDFYEAGRLEGELAARVLRGEDPATLPVEDVMDRVPRRLVINKRALDGLKGPWRIPDEVLASATVVVDADGVHEKKPARPGPASAN